MIEKNKNSSVFFGLILVIIGILVLLEYFGLVELNISALYRLWPMLLVLAGLGMIGNSNNRLIRLITNIGQVLVIVFTVLVATNQIHLGDQVVINSSSDNGSILKDSSELSIKEAKNANVEIRTGAVNLKIESADTEKVALIDELVKKVDMSRRGETIDVIFDISSSLNKIDSQIKLSTKLNIDLSLKTGVNNLDADLSSLRIKSLKIDTGVSRSSFKIGKATDGQPINIDINNGLSVVKLSLPKDSGIRLSGDSGINSLKTEGLDMKDGQTANYERADSRYVISYSSGVSSLEIVYY